MAHAVDPWCLEGPTSTTAPAIVPKAEAVDPTSATIETTQHDPFDFAMPYDADTPESIRRPTPTPKPTRRKPERFPWLPIVAVILVIAVIAGVIAIGISLSGAEGGAVARQSGAAEKRSTEAAAQDRQERSAAGQRPRDCREVPPQRFRPRHCFRHRAMAGLRAREAICIDAAGGEARRLPSLHGVDPLSVVERIIIGVGEDDKSVIVLQGRGLVTPRLLDGAKTWPGVTTEPAWPGGPDLYVLGQKAGTGEAFAATSETCVILSPHRDRIVEMLEKREGMKKTKFADITLERGLEYAHARPFAAFATLGLALWLGLCSPLPAN